MIAAESAIGEIAKERGTAKNLFRCRTGMEDFDEHGGKAGPTYFEKGQWRRNGC